ncbi:hypothetical protein [Psychroserpens luteolus]|uniref:hypothetical protein n=1 Tax=Psychroserpens luteolus TaxID=2855840 RepID=UPI001E5ECFCE|nr:hypothetical protein [Psychroserpens luteolus]MCD2259009.1 hypothetical protein [Psychroserpens luteolus]
MTEDIIKQGKTLACVSYLPIFGTLIAYYLNADKKNPFTSFHIRQALGLWLAYLICAISVSNFDSATLRMCLWVFFGTLVLYGFIIAFLGKLQTIPVLGPYFQKWFSNIGK